MEDKTLHLTLKKKWFEQTKSLIKTEDYREITPFWMARLLLCRGNKKPQSFWNRCYSLMYSDEWIKTFFEDTEIHGITPVPFTENIMTLGYPKTGDKDRTVIFEHAGIEIRTGNTKWGAEPNKLYFVIKHGNLKP